MRQGVRPRKGEHTELYLEKSIEKTIGNKKEGEVFRLTTDMVGGLS